jgi:predicted component of type VI protein secretion system
MSEGISIIDTRTNIKKSNQLFQAQTFHFQADPSIARRCHESSPDAIPVILRGSKTSKTTIGRGQDATIKIGKANKRVSREHAVIEHKPQWNGFEITILSPNGALIDHIIFVEGERVPILEGTLIEIVGTKMIFEAPKDDEDPSITQQEECITIPIISKVTQQEEADISNTITQIKPTTTTNQFIKSTAPRLKQTARNITKKPLSLEDQIIQVLGKVLLVCYL